MWSGEAKKMFISLHGNNFRSNMSTMCNLENGLGYAHNLELHSRGSFSPVIRKTKFGPDSRDSEQISRFDAANRRVPVQRSDNGEQLTDTAIGTTVPSDDFASREYPKSFRGEPSELG